MVRGKVEGVQPPAWMGRKSPSRNGCRNTRDKGLPAKSPGESDGDEGKGKCWLICRPKGYLFESWNEADRPGIRLLRPVPERAPSFVDCTMQSTGDACSLCVVIVDLKATTLAAASVSTEARLLDADHVPLPMSRTTRPSNPTRYCLISNHDGSRSACLRAIASKLADDRESDAAIAAADAV